MDEQLKNVSNSNKVKRGESGKIAPPTMKGQVAVKKKNGIVKFAEAFLPEDVSDVRSYILIDVIIPTIKKIAEEIFHIFLYGSGDSYSRSRMPSSRASYQNYYDRKRSVEASRSRSNQSVYIMDFDFAFEFEEDAHDFVKWMLTMIAEDSFVRLSEANEFVGKSGDWTDTHYGWTNINGWTIMDTRRIGSKDRYILKLPKPYVID